MTDAPLSTRSAEQRAALQRLEHQPGFFELAKDLFRDADAWPTVAMMAAEIGLFATGAWCAWRFGQSEDTLQALRWGLPALGMVLMAFVIKFAFWPVMHINRLKRQVAELNLRLIRDVR